MECGNQSDENVLKPQRNIRNKKQQSEHLDKGDEEWEKERKRSRSLINSASEVQSDE